MNSKQIEQYLGFLGQKLANMQVKASILILGGAVMVTQVTFLLLEPARV